MMGVIDTLHRWLGGLIGLLLAMLGLTGAILVHRRLWIMVPHAADAPRQTTEAVAARVGRLMGDAANRPEMIVFGDRDFGLDRLAYKGAAGAYADQAGNIVAHWSSQWQRPELWLLDLHQHLFAGETGETAIGLAALVGIGFVVTGAILWWRMRRTFALRLWPQRMSRPAIVRHHRDLGIVVAPLLLLSLVTGAVLVFRPLSALLFGPAAPRTIAASLKGPPPRFDRLSDTLDWPGMIRIARARFPDTEIRSLSLPRKGNGLITLRMKRPSEWLPNGRTTIWFAAADGRPIAARDAADLPRTVRAYNLLYPLHAAEVGGLPLRLLMTISGLAFGLLGSLTVWTFWFKRPRNQPPKRARER
ncbi:Uncharacterized iron-regulated membrane protein [Sphingomonas sp. YR710]|nr:Uncharacterized iron-regulated membrane protein [Sphingomonas sp. YR710]